MRQHKPFDVVDTRNGWCIVSRTGRYRRWSPTMSRGLARLCARRPDTREMVL